MHRPFKLGSALFWSALLLFCLTGSRPPDPPAAVIDLNPPNRPPIIAAWLRGARAASGPIVVTVASHVNSYSEVSAFSYTIERDGSLTANNPVRDAVLVDFARLNGIRVVPTISSTWEATSITHVLQDPTLRAAHINAILQVARSPLVDGIDLDYENLPPDARQAFTDFVTSLASLLHREGKTLSVTVPPKVSDDDACVICRFSDYAALGVAADQIRIMAYEFHGKNGGPGPDAPIWWIRQVASYAVSRIPREKIILGIHLYAYDWGGKETTAMWWSDVQALKKRYGGEVHYVDMDANGVVGESVLTYSVPGPRCPRHSLDCDPPPPEDHTVWFVDARYVRASWDLVKEFRLGGIVLWRPGGEDPAIWDVLKPSSSIAAH
ncbi:MAG: glycosyl hydrolase family 18 protein [Chloroflexi bacterium]|nr:glycosyl hydrolase family 18 protein [Chloroflexota bacterium]